MQIKTIRNQSGLGLIEVIAALGISTIVITALVSLTIFTVKISLRAKLLLEGSKYANSEMELIRAYRDGATWAIFKTSVQPCSGSSDPISDSICNISGNGTGVASGEKTYDGGTPDENDDVTVYFTATKTDNAPLPEDVDILAGVAAVRVTVKAVWYDGPRNNIANQRSTFLYTDLTNWQQK